MTQPQIGIFAQGTHAHRFLELDLRKGVSPAQALGSLRRLRVPEVSAGGVNLLLAVGPDLWRGIAADQSPADLSPFRQIRGTHRKIAPAPPHHLLILV